MKKTIPIVLNVGLLALFFVLLLKTSLLTYYLKGRFGLTWLAVAIITLMDELPSVFYAPAEAFRFIGPNAIFFIAFAAVFIHYMTTRLAEVAEILELIYRYFMGMKEVIHVSTSRLITFTIAPIFVSCFTFLAWIRPHGTELWTTVTGIVLVAGSLIASKRVPEIKERAQADGQMDLILYEWTRLIQTSTYSSEGSGKKP